MCTFYQLGRLLFSLSEDRDKGTAAAGTRPFIGMFCSTGRHSTDQESVKLAFQTIGESKSYSHRIGGLEFRNINCL